MFLTGLIAALGMLFLLFKFGIKKVIHYDIFFDIAITGFLLFSFAGTYSGMMAAMFGGMHKKLKAALLQLRAPRPAN